jgi:hypothetical protein
MNNDPVVGAIRQLISEGETGKALQTFIEHLETENIYPPLLQTLRVVQANYSTAKRKEANGVLNFSEARSEYAKANDAILSVLEEFASGKSSGFRAFQNSMKKWWLTGGILLIVGIGWWLMQRANLPGANAEDSIAVCPEFIPEARKVMILAFQKLGGEDTRPEVGIRTRISDLTEKNNLKTDVKLVEAESIGKNWPGNAREGAKLGRKCMADLIIWGEYEKFNDSISVDIRYAFTDEEWPAGSALNTFKNVTEIKSDQMKISNLDEAVLRLCTALALHENRMDLAEKWLMKQPNVNAREALWKEQLKNVKK